jgi:hypothetical protein
MLRPKTSLFITVLAMLLMTASRGAFFAMLIGYSCAAYVFRRYLSLRQILLWTGALIALAAGVLSLLGTHFVALFLERVITESGASDIGVLSSGNTNFWANALDRMIASPSRSSPASVGTRMTQ